MITGGYRFIDTDFIVFTVLHGVKWHRTSVSLFAFPDSRVFRGKKKVDTNDHVKKYEGGSRHSLLMHMFAKVSLLYIYFNYIHHILDQKGLSNSRKVRTSHTSPYYVFLEML